MRSAAGTLLAEEFRRDPEVGMSRVAKPRRQNAHHRKCVTFRSELERREIGGATEVLPPVTVTD